MTARCFMADLRGRCGAPMPAVPQEAGQAFPPRDRPRGREFLPETADAVPVAAGSGRLATACLSILRPSGLPAAQGAVMTWELVPTGRDVPNDVNVIIEIPMNAEPVKYEIDKDSGALMVDRILTTPMRYPCNYGYVPHTLCGDGDPLDALVMMPFPLIPGCVINCRAIGMLEMKDEAGTDEKLIVVPTTKVSPLYKDVDTVRGLAAPIRDQIAHFFEHYKDLEPNKWVKVEGWVDGNAARAEILAGVERYTNAKVKPHF